MAELLSSKNHHLKRLKKLVNQRKTRSAERVFVVEGPLLVNEVMQSSLEIESIFVGLESDKDAGFSEITRLARSQDVAVRFCRAQALGSVLDTVNPQPVAALVVQPEYRLAELAVDRPVLVLVDVADPGNVGTLARTAEASGCGGIVVLGRSVDLWSPKVVRASAGSLFRLKTIVSSEVASVLGEFVEQERSVAASIVSEDALPYQSVDLSTAAIVVGNEAHGLPAEVAALCSDQVTIQLDGPTESLNVATAGAVLCFESLRQRRLRE